MAAQQIGSKTKSVSVNGVAQLISPAENTNGFTLCTASMHIGASYMGLSVGKVAPANYWSNTAPYILSCRAVSSSGSGLPGDSANLPYPLEVPAGQGLWVTSGDAAFAFITYEPIV